MADETPSKSSPQDVELLLCRYLNGDADAADLEMVNRQLAADPGLRDTFVTFARLHGLLSERGARCRGVNLLDDDLTVAMAPELAMHETMIVPAIREEVPEFETPVTPDTSFRLTPLPPQRHGPITALMHAALRLTIRRAAMILLPLMALLGTLWFIQHRAHYAAVIVASTDAQWDQDDRLIGDDLPIGTHCKLAAGFSEMRFSKGAEVVIEGPAEFVLRSNHELFMSSGKLSAHINGGGFIVSTSTTTVTDLGTDFGVRVLADDRCEVAVFKGSVQVQTSAGSTGTANRPVIGSSRLLTAGEAVSVGPTSITFEPSAAISQSFTRSLNTPAASLDMVDLVAGGDGTTHLRGCGIDAKGNWGAVQPVLTVETDGKYHLVPLLPVVNGVFIPNRNGSMNQLDSAGHTFAFDTNLGLSFGNIWAGGLIPSVRGQETFPSTLGSVDYSTSDHGLLLLHGARGLTFDLEAIRRLHPNQQISKFRCVTGNLYAGDAVGPAHVWVFTDGRQAAKIGPFDGHDGALPIDVPLSDSTRFLTIVTQYAGSHRHSWIVLGDPSLELKPR